MLFWTIFIVTYFYIGFLVTKDNSSNEIYLIDRIGHFCFQLILWLPVLLFAFIFYVSGLRKRRRRLFELATISTRSMLVKKNEKNETPAATSPTHTPISLLSVVFLEFELQETGEVLCVVTNDEYTYLRMLLRRLPIDFTTRDLTNCLREDYAQTKSALDENE